MKFIILILLIISIFAYIDKVKKKKLFFSIVNF